MRKLADEIRPVWRDAYGVGNPLIDAQHQEFFSDLNAIIQAVDDRLPLAEILVPYDQFVDNLSTHFRDEEAMLADHNYPDQEGHRAEHRALMLSVRAIRSKLTGSESIAAMVVIIRTILVALIEHLVAEDMRYKKFLARQTEQPKRA